MTLSTSTRPAAAIAAVCLALTACGPGQPQPTPSASAGGATSPTAAQPSASPATAAATPIDAYRGMWKAYVDAIRIPDPHHPDLARYTQGDALKVFVNGLTNVQNNKLVGQGDVTINPSVTGANPNATPPTVDILDCVDTSQSHLVKQDGSAYQDTPGGKRSAKATVTRLGDGSWKVSSFALFAVGTC